MPFTLVTVNAVGVNSTVYAGAKLFLYQAGTLTPQAGFVDSSGNTAHSNPVIADANGQEAVWLDRTKSYKLVLKDSTEATTLFSQDNFNPSVQAGLIISPQAQGDQNVGTTDSVQFASVTTTGGITSGGNLAVTGQISATDSISVGNDLTVTDDATIGGILNVTGDIAAGANLSVTGTTTGNNANFTGTVTAAAANVSGTLAADRVDATTLSASGDLTVGGDLDVTGNLSAGSITASVVSSNVNITGGSITGITDLAIADGGTGASTAAGMRQNFALVPGTNIQVQNALLQAISDLSTAQNELIYTLNTNQVATTPITAFARTLLDDADAAAMRATIGVATGTGDLVATNALSEIAALGSSSQASARTNIAASGSAALASTSNGEGASLIGVEDSDAHFASTTVEGALREARLNGLISGGTVAASSGVLTVVPQRLYTLTAGDTITGVNGLADGQSFSFIVPATGSNITLTDGGSPGTGQAFTLDGGDKVLIPGTDLAVFRVTQTGSVLRLSGGGSASIGLVSSLADLGDATNAVNTAGKSEGALVRVKDHTTTPKTDRIYRALGSSATSEWRPEDDQSGFSDTIPS